MSTRKVVRARPVRHVVHRGARGIQGATATGSVAALDDIGDVAVPSVTSGQVLTYSAGTWIATTITGSSGGGTGVTDGDKGDVIVTSTGTVWTLDSNGSTLLTVGQQAYSSSQTYANGLITTESGLRVSGDAAGIAYTNQVVASGISLTGLSGATGSGSGITSVLAYESSGPKIATAMQLADTVNTAGAVMESDYDANTILAATTDNTPVALTVGASTIVGRKATGNIVALTSGETKTILGLTAAEVTNTAAGNISSTNVQTALNELDTEKAALAGATFTGDVAMGNGTGRLEVKSTGGANQVLWYRADADTQPAIGFLEFLGSPCIVGGVGGTTAVSVVGYYGAGAFTYSVGEVRIDTPGTGATAVPTLGGTGTFTNKRITRRVTPTTGNAPTWNADNCDQLEATAITAAVNLSTNYTAGTPVAGDEKTVCLTANGAYSITWPSAYEASGTIALPTTTTTGSVRTMYKFLWNPATSKFTIVGVS